MTDSERSQLFMATVLANLNITVFWIDSFHTILTLRSRTSSIFLLVVSAVIDSMHVSSQNLTEVKSQASVQLMDAL
jgi:hypothetical protein